MFELLDDGREVRRTAILRPGYGFLAVLAVLAIGMHVGLLIGKRDSDLLDWFAVGFNGLLIVMVFSPLFCELYKFLRDHEGR
jgi:hypothetical protein